MLNNQKCHFFFLSFAKLESRREEYILPGGEGVIPMGGGEKEGNGYKTMNMV
jgi:hypothetical protein